jgi:carboxypeptidase family protein/TonB-dependent receptor-like protein
MRFRPDLAVALLLGCSSLARAQATATTGVIDGHVYDPSGAVLPEATVLAHNVVTGFERTARCDSAGRFRLSLLPLGSYTLAAQAPGFEPLEREAMELSVGQTLSISIALKLAVVEESIDVRSESRAVETTRSFSANVVDKASIETLPSNGRRFQDLVFLTPGVVTTQTSGLVAIGGQRGLGTAYTIDGADAGQPQFGGIQGGERSGVAYLVSQEAIQEVQVTNAGYSVEFGGSGGGMLNAVTRSGGNDLRGSAFWFFQNQALVADDPFGRPPSDFTQHQFGATLGGPIRKDRLHFFLTYDQQIHRNPFVVKFGTDPAGIPGFEGQEGVFTQTNDIETALARFDWRLSDRQGLSLRYNFGHNRAENGSSGNPTDATVAASSLERDTTNTLVAELNSAFSASRLNVARFQWGRESRRSEPNGPGPMVVVVGLGSTGRSFFLPARPTDERFQLADTFTLVRGPHALRFGADMDLMHTRISYFLPFGGGFYLFPSVPDYLRTLETGEQGWAFFIQGFGNPSGSFWQKELAAFAQDTWKAKANLTLSLGVRYEAHLQPQPDEPNPDLPGSAYIPSDKKQIGPRAGLVWDPWRDGRGALRVNAGLFYSRTPGTLLYTASFQNGYARGLLNVLPFVPGAPRFPDVLPSRPESGLPPFAYVVSPEFRNPRAFQTSAGIEREIVPRLTLSIDLTHGHTRFLSRLFDTNLFPAAGRAPDGRLVYPTERPNPAYQQIQQLESTARSTYDALTLGLKGRWGGSAREGVHLQAFYTLSRNEDDDSSERKEDLAIVYQDWQNLAAEYTWSDSDKAGNDLNNDADFGNDRQFIDGVDTGRNSYRQPGYTRLDLRLAKSFRLSARRGIKVAFDLFNAFNAKNLFVPPQNQVFEGGEPGTLNPALDHADAQAGGPRTVQLSARFSF